MKKYLNKFGVDFLFLVGCLSISLLICLANIIKFNLFSVICCLILVSANCLAIGYIYGKKNGKELDKCESKKENSEEILTEGVVEEKSI